MAIEPRKRPHDSGPCPFPIVDVQEMLNKVFPVPQTEEEWALAARKKKIDANDLVHELGPKGFRQWLNESPTHCLWWSESEIVSARSFMNYYPKMREPVIHDVLRRSETMNIIAAPKAGKSWLGLNIAMNVIGGGKLFDKFQCERGKVLLIDNELHCETIAERIKKVAEALNVPYDRAGSLIDILSLRGRLVGIDDLSEKLQYVRRRAYNIVLIDSFYKVTAPIDLRSRSFDENSNSDMAAIYTKLDALAEHLDSALILIHHSSKGSQAGKGITDIGAGGGSQSRACDTHLTIREHEEKSIFRIDAVNRSFGPLEPFCARFKWPKWEATSHDVELLRGMAKKNGLGSMRVGGDGQTMTKEQKKEHEKQRAREFVLRVLDKPMSQGDILSAGNGNGFYPWNRDRARELIEELQKEKAIKVAVEGAGRTATTYILSTIQEVAPAPAVPEVQTEPQVEDQNVEQNYDGYTADYSCEENDEKDE